MANKCSICSNLRCDEINAAIHHSVSFRAIACQYKVNRESVRRHAANCLPAATARVEDNPDLKAAVNAALPDAIVEASRLTTSAVVSDVLQKVLDVIDKEGLTQDHAVTLLPKLTDQRAKLHGEYYAKRPNHDEDLAWLKNFYERHKHREETLKTAREWGIDPGLISPELASDVKDGGDLAQ